MWSSTPHFVSPTNRLKGRLAMRCKRERSSIHRFGKTISPGEDGNYRPHVKIYGAR
jgi:hypothetical protein